jgi:hypothetical protein
MKTLLSVVAVATIIASPAFAQKAPKVSPNAVVVDGQAVGQDPDPNIRFQLRREAEHGIDWSSYGRPMKTPGVRLGFLYATKASARKQFVDCPPKLRLFIGFAGIDFSLPSAAILLFARGCQSSGREARWWRHHKHPKVREWLARHPRWTFHFTPTSASWLNAVEGFFAKLTRQRLKRGVFRSVAELQAAILPLHRWGQSCPETLRLDRQAA